MHLAKPCALVASVQDYYNQVDVLTLLYNSSNYSDNAEKLSASKKGSDLPTIVNTPRLQRLFVARASVSAEMSAEKQNKVNKKLKK